MRKTALPFLTVTVLFLTGAVAVGQTIDRVAAVVQIDTGGSGVIVHVGPRRAVGISCGHVAGKVGRTSGFQNFDGSRGVLRWEVRDKDHELSMFSTDSASVRWYVPISKKDLSGPFTAAGYTGAKGVMCRKWLKPIEKARPLTLSMDR